MSVEASLTFRAEWLFIGITNELTSSSGVLRKQSPLYDILIVKDEEKYHAFWNVCPHRNHPIVSADTEHVDLTCPYHGWCFHADGALRSIPFEKECYQFSESERRSIHLKPVALEKIGQFLFINLSARPFPIERQFNTKLRDELASLSLAIKHVRVVKQVRKFHWTLICENLRDGLHPVFLHQNSLMKAISFSPPAIPKDVPIQFLRLRDGSYGGPDVPITTKFALADRFPKPWPTQGRYYNYHLYPNVHIAIADGGYSFVIERFLPISETETEVSIYYCLTENNLSDPERETLLDRLQVESFQVYEEDFAALEKIQDLYVSGAARSYKMGIYERMISRFHKINLKRNGFSWLWLRAFLIDLVKIPFFIFRMLRRTRS